MNETSKNQRKKSLLGQLSNLAVGEELTVPVSRSSYLKSICVSFGLQWDKKFSTSTNREERTITATRIFLIFITCIHSARSIQGFAHTENV